MESIKEKLNGWWKAPGKEIYVKWIKASNANYGAVKIVLWFNSDGSWKWKMTDRNGFSVKNPSVYEEALLKLLNVTKQELAEHEV